MDSTLTPGFSHKFCIGALTLHGLIDSTYSYIFIHIIDFTVNSWTLYWLMDITLTYGIHNCYFKLHHSFLVVLGSAFLSLVPGPWSLVPGPLPGKTGALVTATRSCVVIGLSGCLRSTVLDCKVSPRL